MRAPCARCLWETGRIEQRGGQACVFCEACGQFQYNAPRTETGAVQRSVSTVHEAIRPKQRTRILLRANGRCELCGAGGLLHVGHLLSVDAGLEAGLTDAEINGDENLSAMCEECNLGLGKTPAPPRLLVALLRRRAAS